MFYVIFVHFFMHLLAFLWLEISMVSVFDRHTFEIQSEPTEEPQVWNVLLCFLNKDKEIH